MKTISKITTFRDVNIENKKTLIICDIDDTVLKWELNLSHFIEQSQRDFSNCDVLTIENHARNLYSVYVGNTDPITTDLSGFRDMLRRLHLHPGSDLVFLTARFGSIKNIEHTKKEMSNIGLPNMYNIYFTSNIITKGEYIIKNIAWNNYEKVIFIDDQIINLFSVEFCCPTIELYQFVI